MITCPVCEHAQGVGPECEVCGRLLEEGPGSGLAVAPPLEGLEPTGLAGALDVPAEPVPGLEPTRLEGWGDPPPETVPDLEATRAPPVEVAAEPLADLEPTFAAPIDEGPAPLLATVICRYCRTEAAPGERRCGRCGMRLPVPLSAAPAGLDRPHALCSCGTPVTRSICPACGARTATA
jgi:hypothetical protein